MSVYRRGKVEHSYARTGREMPTAFSLTDNHDGVTMFLRQLRHSLDLAGEKLERLRMSGGIDRGRRRRYRRIYESYDDFATMERITPAAALVLASEYDRANILYNYGDDLKAIDIEKWKPAVRLTLQEVGFLPLLGVDWPPASLAERDGVYTVPFISGRKVDGSSIESLIRLLADFAKGEGIEDSDTLLRRSRLYDGLGEAIQNVEDHAYPDGISFSSPPVKQWWMTGAVEPQKKRFNLMIYDQGISIPVSLPRSNLFDDFRGAFLKVLGREFDPDVREHDGQAIAQAVQLGRSKTGEPWHGKGLPRMREIVDNASDGILRIISRCGEYIYRRGKTYACRSFEVPLSGTLVEWDLCL